MELNKAIRKQKKSYKRFMLTMCFIFFMLPLIVFVTNKHTWFFISYLLVIEFLIVAAIIVKTSYETFDYRVDISKIKIKDGLFGSTYNIGYEKVELVHVEEKEDGIDLIMLLSSRLRNKNIKPIDRDFLKRYSILAHEYSKLKKLRPETEYYYLIIKKGGFIKYKLLMDIYKVCVRAKYTESSIENIKEWMTDK